MTMERFLLFSFVCVAMIFSMVLGESSETNGGGLSALLKAQLLSSHNQQPASTNINHNVHIQNQVKKHLSRKITHNTHVQSHGKTHIPAQITPITHSQSKGKEQLPATMHQNVHTKSQQREHIQGKKITHKSHIKSPEMEQLPRKNLPITHTQDQGRKHLPDQITHNTHIQKQEKKHIPVPVPVHSERHTDNMTHRNTRANVDQSASKVRTSKSNSQSKNKTVPQVGNIKEQLLGKSKEAKPNPQSDLHEMNVAAKIIEDEALNIPVTIRIMFPHYIQVKNKWYPLKLRFGVPQP